MEQSESRSERTTGLDRRSFLQKSVVATGVAWTVPVISTLREPAAAAIGSGGCPYVYCFDSGTTEGWTINNSAGAGNGLWQVNNGRSVSPSSSMHYGRGVGGTYLVTNAGGTSIANGGTVTSPAISIPAAGGNLTFSLRRQVETFGSGNWDAFNVSILPGGTSIYNVARDGGTGGAFVPISLNLAAFAGTTIQIVLSFQTGDGVNNSFEGIWVDDVTVPCTTPPPGSLGTTSSLTSRSSEDPNGFFPQGPEPTRRELRERRRAAASQWEGSVSG